MRGKIGQNLSYFKNYAGRVLIDAAKQGETPVVSGADLKWVVFVGPAKGDKSYDGAYAITADEPFDFKITGGSPAKIVSPGVVAVTVGDRPTVTPQLQLLFTGRATLPKGIRVIRPGYTVAQADAQVFTTEYVDLLKRLNVGCIRLMDALRTNGSECTDGWCDPSATLWSVKGIGAPLEPLALLAELVDADAWMNVPPKGTDAYVRKAAELFKAKLGPGKRLYVEYGNELWNDGNESFKASKDYVAAQGAAVGLTVRQQYAKRSAEVAAIVLDVFKDQPWRVVPVLAGATNDSGVLADALACLAGKPNPFKALAVAGYFGAPRGAKTADEVFASLAGNASALWAGVQMAKFDKQVKSGPYEKVIYEWTASIEGTAAGVPEAVMNDPRIGPAIAAWGVGAFGAGVGMACHFVPLADPGTQGYAATDAVEKITPKVQALADLSAAHPHPAAMDPRDAEIAGLRLKLTAAEAGLEALRGNLRDLSAALTAAQAAVTESQASEAAAKAEAAEKGGRITAAKAALGN